MVKDTKAKLNNDRAMLSSDKFKEYMVEQGCLTGVYILPTEIFKKKPPKKTRAELERMGRSERNLYKQQIEDYEQSVNDLRRRSFLEITGSWVELSIYLLGTIYLNNKNNFMTTLISKGALSDGFRIQREVLEYTSDNDKVRIFTVPGTSYYLETNNSSSSLYRAIKAMIEILNMQENKEILFDIKVKENKR